MRPFCCSSLFALVIAVLCVLSSSWPAVVVAGEPPQLERLFPAAIQIGQTQQIKAEGKFSSWPVRLLESSPGVEVQCGEQEGQLELNVQPDCRPGVCWLRVANDYGVSAAVPLLLTRSQTLAETEPNNALEESAAINLPMVVVGKLGRSGDVDAFRVGLTQGQRLIATVVANRALGSPMDAVLQVVDAAGNVLLQGDDQRGLDPQLVYQAETTGEVIVRLMAFPETPNSTIGFSGSAEYQYALQLTTGPFTNHFLPLLASEQTTFQRFGWNSDRWGLLGDAKCSWNTLGAATASSPNDDGWQWCPRLQDELFVSQLEGHAAQYRLPAVYSGHIATPGEVDSYEFDVHKGDMYQARVYSREFGFPVDSVLQLEETEKVDKLNVRDDVSRTNYDSELTFVAKEDTRLKLSVSDLVGAAGPQYAYSIVVQPLRPTVQLTVASDRFVLPSAGNVEIEVAVERQHGYSMALNISAVDLPQGVTCEAVESLNGKPTGKSVKLRLVADDLEELQQASFRIIAQREKSQAAVDAEQAVVAQARFALRRHVEIERFWLTKTVAGP